MKPPQESDLASLERFVVENDDLLELEATIGRFNIFDALRIERAEIRHSNFLAWLLTPSESHGQGDLFLKAVMMDVLRLAHPSQRPLSPVALDGEELHDVGVRREYRNIDLMVICGQRREAHDGGEGQGLYGARWRARPALRYAFRAECSDIPTRTATHAASETRLHTTSNGLKVRWECLKRGEAEWPPPGLSSGTYSLAGWYHLPACPTA